MSDLKVGDVVYLKSGGPAMTVNAITPSMIAKAVVCVWFVGNENKSATYSPDALTKEAPRLKNQDDNSSQGYGNPSYHPLE
ncbi:DUF2158 domain-containing protein [Acinetobacter terrestris]|uniref:YodC family protein n=1 Tax=Acinetobacter terrestris TaxID=2529843 RepID=UPI001039B76F|nr:DUF2158 domain-containing protein [Acinetobacter terrestris]TCB48389.1 DUF2158 domain-containing protein [Acinetobacter terrestris]